MEVRYLLEQLLAALSALLAAAFIAWLVKTRLNDKREEARDFAWTKPAEADPSWKGDVLEKPSLHPDSDNARITCYDPSTGYRLAVFPSPTPQDMHDLVTRAEAASMTWRNSTFAQRRQVLRSLLAFCIREKQSIAEICCRDTGKTMLDAALGEILTTCEKLRWLIGYGEAYLEPDFRPTSWLLAHKTSYVHYEPLGVVGAIVSWNYPFHNLLSPVIAAIMSGNAIVVKTSENVAWSSKHFTDAIRSCLQACGQDPDVVQVAIGCEAEAAAAFTRDERLAHLTFIGSDAVGKQVALGAAEALTPVTLELGGKDACVVLASADVSFFQDIYLRGAFTGAGQGCIAAERFIVDAAVYDTFISILTKRVKELRAGIDVGAMINGNRLQHLQSLVEEAVSQGARLLVGGKIYEHPKYPQAHYFSPTLLCDVTNEMRIAQEECFAPIMLVMKANDIDDCIRIANGTKYALGASVFGRSKADCRYVTERLQCGMVSVNDFGVFYLNQGTPFGGAKASGYHRFGGPEGLRSLCNLKTVTEDKLHGWVQTSIPPPLRYPVVDGKMAWRFVSGLIDLIYHPEWLGKAGGLYGLITPKSYKK